MDLVYKLQSCWECWMILAVTAFIVATVLNEWNGYSASMGLSANVPQDSQKMTEASKGLFIVSAVAAVMAFWGYTMPLKHHMGGSGGFGGLGGMGRFPRF